MTHNTCALYEHDAHCVPDNRNQMRRDVFRVTAVLDLIVIGFFFFFRLFDFSNGDKRQFARYDVQLERSGGQLGGRNVFTIRKWKTIIVLAIRSNNYYVNTKCTQEQIKSFLNRRDRGELFIQKTRKTYASLLKPVSVLVRTDKNVTSARMGDRPTDMSIIPSVLNTNYV